MPRPALPATDLEGLEGSERLLGIDRAIACRGDQYRNSVPTLPTLPNPEPSSGTELLNVCRRLDIRLWVDCGRLRYDAPAGALDDALRAEIGAQKAELLALLATSEVQADPLDPAEPDPLDALTGPRRTAWGTLAWSDSSAPPLELFGPPDDDVRGPVRGPTPDPDPWTQPVPRAERRGR